MSQSDTWRWADEQGEQRLVTADELRTAITNGVLPPSTLVWREGMDSWVAASSVAEFANPPAATEAKRSAEKPAAATNTSATPTNQAPVGPARSTLQGIHAREVFEAVKSQVEKDPPKDKRTPSVAPPRPNVSGSGKPPLVKTLRPNFGPAIPAAPRLPSDSPPKPAITPRPVVAPRATAQAKPAPPVAAPTPPVATPTPAPPVRAPSTSAIDKDWAIADDETTNVPDKKAAVAPRPEPPPEAAPSPPAAVQPAQPSRASVVRSAPPPSPHNERIIAHETTESTTFQFAKNTLSLRVVKPPVGDEDDDDAANVTEVLKAEPLPRPQAPPGLMESYGKSPVVGHKRSGDEPPPTTPSADLGLVSDEQIPAFANTTARLEPLPDTPGLPVPPKVREPTATTMLPIDFHPEPEPDEDDKRPHEVSRTIRLAADFLTKVLSPGRAAQTSRLDMNQPGLIGGLFQMKPPPLPPPSAAGPSDPQEFVRLQSGTPHAATSLALRQVKTPPGEAQQPPQLPLNALLVSGGLLILMVIGAFFVGRCSVKPTASVAPKARSMGATVRAIQDNLPGPPKPCWVVKQPARWAPVVSKNLPFEMLVLPTGKVAIGYAKNDDEAVGIEVTPATGQVDEDYADKASSEIARVTPTGKGFFISTKEPPGSLKSLVPVYSEKLFYLGIADKHVSWADQPSGVANRIWPINESDISGGIHTLSLGGRGILTAFRSGSSRQRKVYAGLLGVDRKPLSKLVNVVGSGGAASEPNVGSNGREVAVVFSDHPGDQGPLKVHFGHAPMGKIPEKTTVFDVPAGGPGSDANYPSIAGLADGRWVMAWTEGSSGGRAIRAQTFAANFSTVGDPIVLSMPSGYYGPSMVGVVGNYVTVVFVLKGRGNNELWGSVLQCG